VDLNALVADLLPRQGRDRAPPLRWKLGGLPILHLDPDWVHEAWHQLIQSALQFNVGNLPPLVEIGSFVENKQWVCYLHHDGWNLTVSPPPAAQEVRQSDRTPLKNPLWETRWWIVHRILQRHGGRVWVKSQGDSGTAVYLGFPLSLQAD
jgi:light-regulated signal transduction histidine kinase (bacteriophytochrome)